MRAINVRSPVFAALRFAYAMFSRRRRYPSSRLLLAAAIVACGPTTPEEEPTPCLVEAPTACTAPELRWADVAPIFENRCQSCHDGKPSSPWPLDTYAHVADWYDVLRDELLHCNMPPREAVEELPLEERDKLLMWIRCGFPE